MPSGTEETKATDRQLLDRRVLDLEQKMYRFEATFPQIAEDIREIRNGFQEFLAVKGKLDTIDAVSTKVDTLRTDFQGYQLQLAPLVSDHQERKNGCPVHLADRSTFAAEVLALTNRITSLEESKKGTEKFIVGRIAGILDWAVKIAIVALASYIVTHGIRP